MPSTPAPAPLIGVEVPAGRPGADAVAQALRAAARGTQSSVLIPTYSPGSLQARLNRLVGEADWDGQAGPAVCVPTSGSTGSPRSVVMPWRTLSTVAAARDAVLGGPAAWLVAVPPATAGGVVALARALRAGTPYEAWTGVGGAGRFSAAAFLDDAERLLRRAETAGVPARVSVVSTQVARLLSDAQGEEALRRFDTVLVGGGPMSDRLRSSAAAAGVRIVATYGMTETCGGCAYDGTPVPGTQVSVSGSGELLVRGDCIAAGYLDGPLTTLDGWLCTGDRGSWDGVRLSVRGRLDDVVTVRGANVDVAAVAAVVAELPAVAQSAIIAIDDPAGGHRLRAFVVGDADPQTVRAAVHTSLGAAAVPEVVVVEQLPSNSGGKADVQRLQEDAG